MIDVKRIREQFPIYKKYPNLRFFDSGASALVHENVIKKMSDYMSYNGTNVHRGVYSLAYEATNLYENARGVIAKFINAKENQIIFTKSTTHSLNMLATSFKSILEPGDEIIISELEHHSNLLPWLNIADELKLVVRFIPLENGLITIPNFKSVLTTKTKLVVTHHMSNVIGYVTPIKEMVKLAKLYGAYVILDAAQSILHIKTDIQDLNIDALAFSGHKLYGPNGVGILYLNDHLSEILPPAEFGGEMVDTVNLDGSTWKTVPYKFESGTPPIAEAIGLAEAINFINDVGIDNIHEHELNLRNYCIKALENEKGITIFNKAHDSTIISFNIDGIHPHDTASFLDQQGVCVRAGHHCNQLTMRYLKQDATVRASIAIYNSIEDCDILINAIKETRDFFTSL
ncbi:aminotransferase class V-fold PLP-dependent enzyme [Acholeplasma granularum]|uniref:aminotransferase class V-fold PLP-dependent enzyme n=1 Tax=Acholeplasma granularum TaxID=264635 RepID=UPI0004ACFDF1|nr:cysteine desulfurase [Acholeplasma granularum]